MIRLIMLVVLYFSQTMLFVANAQQNIRDSFLVETISRYDNSTNFATAEFLYDENNKLLSKNVTGKMIENSQLRDLHYVDEFEYENGLVSKIKIHDYTHFMFSHELRFFYNDNNQIIRKEIWKNGYLIDHNNYHFENNRVVSVFDDNTLPFERSTFTYNEQNNVSIHSVTYALTDISGQIIPGEFETRELLYEYDNHPKPNFGIDYVHCYQPFPWIGGIVDLEINLSQNNMTKAISQEETYNYTYNEHGLPATLHDIFDPIGPLPGQLYTITYKEIGALNVSEFNNPKMHIYPNPTKDIVFIECEMIGNLVLYDMLGRKVLVDIFNEKSQIDLTNLSTGTYNLKLISQDGSVEINQKLIKN